MYAPRLVASLALLLTLSLRAQTYQPKTIRLQGADAMDQAEVMRLIDLKPGAPVSKEQIDAAMQRLADSGLFADLSYRVSSEALVFVVKPVSGAQSESVRFSNFVWWRPGELEPLVEARVPLFHGKLPLTGQLTTEVQQALVALLAEKGVLGAKVEAMQSTLGGRGVALTITQPQIVVGDLTLRGTAQEAAEQMNRVASRLTGRDFDAAETPSTIVANTMDTHRNAGYLDAAVDPPSFSAPHKRGVSYAVDATAVVHPGTQYHIAGLTYHGLDPKLEPEIAKTSGVKVGDPAEEMTLRIAEGLCARALTNHGMLDATSQAQVSKDNATHTVAYDFHLTPGPVYTLASVDVTALSAEGQARFNAAFHAHPGQVADGALRMELLRALNAAGAPRSVGMSARRNRTDHTVAYVLAARGAGSPPPDPS